MKSVYQEIHRILILKIDSAFSEIAENTGTISDKSFFKIRPPLQFEIENFQLFKILSKFCTI
jgi:hypothetical protein